MINLWQGGSNKVALPLLYLRNLGTVFSPSQPQAMLDHHLPPWVFSTMTLEASINLPTQFEMQDDCRESNFAYTWKCKSIILINQRKQNIIATDIKNREKKKLALWQETKFLLAKKLYMSNESSQSAKNIWIKKTVHFFKFPFKFLLMTPSRIQPREICTDLWRL